MIENNALLAVLGIFLAIPLAIYADRRAWIKSQEVEDSEYDPNHRSIDSIILFTPFASLFFHEQFWPHLIIFALMVLVGYVAAEFAFRKAWLGHSAELIKFNGVGSVVLTVVLYFIFFHEGVLSESTQEVSSQSDSTNSDSIGAKPLSQWPFIVYGVLGAATIITVLFIQFGRKVSENWVTSLLWIQLIGLNVLPFFISYFWWSWAAGFIVFIASLGVLVNAMEISVRGGLGFVMSYIYMMVAGGCAMVYAFLF